ncbi:MAG: T9SS type A sorting domain-containing protein [Flavobacteriales bacterium]|nr:T9SS type A sorting domain-containing protein [Flavobacteriales bacterium]
MKHTFLLPLLLIATPASAQFALEYDGSAPVIRNGSPLQMAWAGGLNYPQFSDIDLDQDGDKDLWLFDKQGNKVVTLVNQGTAGQPDYVFSHDFDLVEPFRDLKEWALLRDYNCDGKEDIFSYTTGGFAVYKNVSNGNGLAFQLVVPLVTTNYQPTVANLYVTQVDLPGIEDIDLDGDLDIMTFSIFGNYVEYHRNLSMELYGTCDSLSFEVRNRCWGYFSENLNNNSVALNNPCQYNVPNPEIAGEVLRVTQQELHDLYTPTNEDGGERAHVGSTILPIDLDGDEDKDLLLGDVIFDNIAALYNGGSVDSAFMTGQDTLFPVYDQSVHLQIFPAPYYEDVDNDGKRDLIVTPNYKSLSQNFQGVWWYKNTGTDAAPIFQFQQPDLFQNRMIDVGEGAYPVLFDHNGDGLMDLIVANYGYFIFGGNYPCKLALFENTGTTSSPAFTLVDDDYEDLSISGIGNAMYPAFGDMDGDGDKDMYIGDLQGRMHYFTNIATGPVADFQLTTAQITDVGNNVIDVGQFATPQLFDVNGDALLDLLVGERNGNINYLRNMGTASAPIWTLANDSLGGVVVAEWWNVTGYSVPHMYLNDLNERELLVGSEVGWLYHYNGIDGNLNGIFNQTDSMWQDVREGERTAVSLYDFDNDGYRDAIIGNYRGGVSYWKNTFGVGVNENDGLARDAFTLAPNPATEQAEVILQQAASADARISLVNGLGQVIANVPVRSRRISLPVQGLPAGVYMVRLQDRGQQWTQRLILTR